MIAGDYPPFTAEDLEEMAYWDREAEQWADELDADIWCDAGQQEAEDEVEVME